MIIKNQFIAITAFLCCILIYAQKPTVLVKEKNKKNNHRIEEPSTKIENQKKEITRVKRVVKNG